MLKFKSALYRYMTNLLSPLWIIVTFDVLCYAIPFHDRLKLALSVSHLAHLEIWTLITSIFMHVSFIHISTNLGLLIIALVVSDALPINRLDVLICFFTSAVLSDLLLIVICGLFGVNSALMGSSSGIAGVIGFCIVMTISIIRQKIKHYSVDKFHSQLTYSGFRFKLGVLLFIGLYLIMTNLFIHTLGIIAGVIFGLFYLKKRGKYYA